MPDESTPLLESQSSPLHFGSQFSLDGAESTFSATSRGNFLRRRFWWFAALGVAAIIALQLSFLPRTSLNRDFRRWHELHLTKTDVKRIFLVQLQRGHAEHDGLTVEDHVGEWLAEFSAVNAKSPLGMAASVAPELAATVERKMRLFGFATNAHTYPLLQKLRAPVLLALRLVDAAKDRVLYTAPMLEPGAATPAYYVFGANGTVDAPYTYANQATPDDLALLAKHDVPVAGRVLVFAHPLAAEHLLADKIFAAEALGCAAVVVYGDAAADDAVSRQFRPLQPPVPRLRLPVSYSAIQPVLHALSPAMAPFQTWPHSPQPPDDGLHLQMDCEFSPDSLHATNIEASLEGVINDAMIVVGAARDVLTATNPLSGHAVMLEVMRRFQLLRQKGWRPLRTIRFVSWDATHSGALGSRIMVQDSSIFPYNLPVLAYINLDENVVTGDHFSVDANPLFNHVLRDTARFVPFPKNSSHYRRISKSDGNLIEGDTDDDETSLYHYWDLQNGAYINNKVGDAFADTDAGTFQFTFGTPSINMKFEQSPSHNDSLFVPESNLYSLTWLTDAIDKTYVLHSLLVRFLGLLTLTLGEHEVVDYRTAKYFTLAKEFFDGFLGDNAKVLDSWATEEVPTSLVERSALLNDYKHLLDDVNGEVSVTFNTVVMQMQELLNQLRNQSSVFDDYNKSVQEMWIADYPWYKMLKKVHIYAKFKVANYKLLRLEKGLTFNADEAEKLTGRNETHHIMFETPQGQHSRAGMRLRGAFASMYAAVDGRDMNQLVAIMVALYERLKGTYKKIS